MPRAEIIVSRACNPLGPTNIHSKEDISRPPTSYSVLLFIFIRKNDLLLCSFMENGLTDNEAEDFTGRESMWRIFLGSFCSSVLTTGKDTAVRGTERCHLKLTLTRNNGINGGRAKGECSSLMAWPQLNSLHFISPTFVVFSSLHWMRPSAFSPH